ncbi:glycoside hydrolase family 2 protein [Faecalibacterium gallinarum]|uniref:Beta-glucuronidase n=1 Tax=Faecalibacterium gallinarum TaxID=2903556 RepID=A0AA37N2R3_9FIRM|nr:glycoside hydrolase family 2 TIM barrel-domain containing protein [Faecalibacterium gallinarum]GJN65505.1 beta-glucuronidase [Faecalibacterium gallinarum]
MRKYEQENSSDINLEDYLGEYEDKQATVEDLIFDRSRKKESLNGLWHYAVDQYDTCIRQHWFAERYTDQNGFTMPVDYSFDEWPTMQLPCCWNTQSEKFELYDGSMVFTRKFRYEAQNKEKVLLKIGAANYICRVFLNQEYLGMHRGGSTPAYFDVTGLLQAENRIIIQADSTRRPEQVPTENTDWFNYGGVYRDIELIRLPETYIKRFQIALVSDGAFNKIKVRVRLSEPVNTAAQLRIDELGLCAEIPVTEGAGEAVLEAHPVLWCPENPKLYAVSLSCAGDEVSDEVGFREIRVQGHDILLNGKSIFLRGISAHEESVPNGKALTDEERLENIRLAKELGCNFMRAAHYPHDERMARLADREGILLWEEIPVYWAIRFTREKTYADARNQLLELIERDWNRASVIIWSVGNENADSDERLAFMKNLADTAHAADENRLVSAACLVSFRENAIADRLAEHLDVIGLNEYFGWYTPDFRLLPQLFENSHPTKPVIVTELGADALPGHHGTITDKGTEECQVYVYEKQVETLRGIDYVRGMTPWILYDFRCPRRTSVIQGYYNRKGLLNPEKTYKKPAFYVLQRYYQELKEKWEK